MNYVTRENINGNWVNTYFNTMAEAKKLYKSLLKQGRPAICLRSAK